MLPRVPFGSFAMFFAGGILLSGIFPWAEYETVFCLATFSLLVIVIVLYNARHRVLMGLSASFFFLLLGFASYTITNKNVTDQFNSLSTSNILAYKARIISLPEKRKSTIRYEAQITHLLTERRWERATVRILFNVNSKANAQPITGQTVLIKGAPDIPPKALNPYEFDYHNYLWNKGIVWTDYLQEDGFLILNEKSEEGWSLTSLSQCVSQWADRQFRMHLPDDQSYGLVKAMVLGRRDDLQADQMSDYVISGTVHILSVSGMHVAIIFIALSKGLSWLKKLKFGRFLYLIAVASFLGFYALVTGLPPSVQRATLMCYVVIAAETFRRKQFSMNTLAISALLILAGDPHALFDLGFQLSFLAMAGIFLLYDPIHECWSPTHFTLKWIWEITALSFAAQLATFPLSIYYFHQFPLYFWLINPFVILFTNILLPAALVLLLLTLTPFTWLQIIVDKIVDCSAYLSNFSAGVTKALPLNLIENLQLDIVELCLLFALIITSWLICRIREMRVLQWGFVLSLIFMIYSITKSVESYYQSKVYAFSVPKHTVLGIKEGNQLFIVSDSAFLSDRDAYNFRIKNASVNDQVMETVFVSEKSGFRGRNFWIKSWKSGQLIQFKGILIQMGTSSNIQSDANYCFLSPTEIPKTKGSDKTKYLISGEIRGQRAQRWKEYLTRNNLTFYDLAEGFRLLNGIDL